MATRKLMVLFVVILFQFLPFPIRAEVAKFNDVHCGDWFYEEVMILKEKDILSSDNADFRPDNKINRAEFIKMLIKAKYIDGRSKGVSNIDSCSEKEAPWYKCFIREAYRVKNSNNNEEPIAFFLENELKKELKKPDSWELTDIILESLINTERATFDKLLDYDVSRSDAAHMLMNANGRSPDDSEIDEIYTDSLEFDADQRGWIGACYQDDVFKGYEEKDSSGNPTGKRVFDLQMKFSRDQAAVVLVRAFFNKELQSFTGCSGVSVNITAYQAGTVESPGVIVSEQDEDYPQELVVLANYDADELGKDRFRDHYANGYWDPADKDDEVIGSKDNDIVKIILHPLEPFFASERLKLEVSDPSLVRIFTSDGNVLSDYIVDLSNPSGDLKKLVNEPVTLYLETLEPSLDIYITLAFQRKGDGDKWITKSNEKDEIHILSSLESILRSNIVRAAYNQNSNSDNDYKLLFPEENYQVYALRPANNAYWEEKEIKDEINKMLPEGVEMDPKDFEDLILEMYKNENADFKGAFEKIYYKFNSKIITYLTKFLEGKGFSLKEKPFLAVVDLIPFEESEKRNERGRYISECYSAMVMVMYRGVAETFRDVAGEDGEKRFNHCFSKIKIKGTKSTRPYQGTGRQNYSKYYAGDWRYVFNPDFNTDNLSSWRGENTVQLSGDSTDGGMFYWHNGAMKEGVTDLKTMKSELHEHRLSYHRKDENLPVDKRRPPRNADFYVIDNIDEYDAARRIDTLSLMQDAFNGCQ